MAIWVAGEYQGVKVIDIQSDVPCRHPRWGYAPATLAKLKDASILLLADETLLVVCNDCGYNGITGNDPYVKPVGEQKPIIKQADSVLAHKSGTHWLTTPRGSLYTDEQIMAAIKIWLKWDATHIKRSGQAACDELERLGFKPYRSEHWSPSQLGSLVREYMGKPKFKNLKAAPMSAEDQDALADMVREAAESNNGGVAAIARITEKKKPHQHTPVDFKQIIDAASAAKVKQQKEEVNDVAGHEVPTLSFAGKGGEPDDAETMVLDPSSLPVSPATPLLRVEQHSDYKHITELPSGEPMFDYKGELMVGKKIKGVEI